MFCFISALQSPLRVHRDNIYVRHSNLMLEVGTGVDPMAESWQLRVCFYCDAIRAWTCSCTAPCRTAALSHSQAPRACLRVQNVSSVQWSKLECFGVTEMVLDVSSFRADCFSSEQPFHEQRGFKWMYINEASIQVSHIAEGIHRSAMDIFHLPWTLKCCVFIMAALLKGAVLCLFDFHACSVHVDCRFTYYLICKIWSGLCV